MNRLGPRHGIGPGEVHSAVDVKVVSPSKKRDLYFAALRQQVADNLLIEFLVARNWLKEFSGCRDIFCPSRAVVSIGLEFSVRRLGFALEFCIRKAQEVQRLCHNADVLTFAQHCQRCSNAGYFNNLVAGIVSHRSNFVAARLNGTENHQSSPRIRQMSV